MRTFIRKMVASVVRLLPAGAPERIYARLFRGPLGIVVNPLITGLLPESLQIPEGVVILNRTDPAVSGATAFGVYEPFETALFRVTIQPGMTVVDIGANIGYYMVIAAGRVGAEGRVIAFEPAPENFVALKKTIGANTFRNIDAYAIAIADKRGVLDLHLFDSNKGKHSLVKDAKDAKGFSSRVQVQTTTLDSFLSEHDIGHVDVIKMDIEGAESLALAGMHEALKQAKFLFMEFTPTSIRKAGHDPQETLQLLRKAGFSLFAIDERAKEKKLVSDDGLFIASIPEGECTNLLCVK